MLYTGVSSRYRISVAGSFDAQSIVGCDTFVVARLDIRHVDSLHQAAMQPRTTPIQHPIVCVDSELKLVFFLTIDN